MSTYADLISGANGTRIINGTTKTTVKAIAYDICESTLVEALEIDGVDVLADYISDPSNPVKAGMLVPHNKDDRFSAIKLSSGSVTELRA